MSICFLGGGNMANALIGGLVARGYDAHSISVRSGASGVSRCVIT